MFWTTKQKTPEELLQDKYLELIETNQVEVNFRGIYWWNVYEGNILWLNVNFIVKLEEHEEYPYFDEDYRTTYTYSWIIGKVQYSDCDFGETIYKRISSIYEKQQKEIEEERERKAKADQEEIQRKKDIEFMEEYKRLCGSSKEFSKHFELLDKIEALWNSQIQLLTEWEDNKNQIYKYRKEFYSLK